MHYIGSNMCQEGSGRVSIGRHLLICDVREFIANRELMKRKMIGVDTPSHYRCGGVRGGGLYKAAEIFTLEEWVNVRWSIQ